MHIHLLQKGKTVLQWAFKLNTASATAETDIKGCILKVKWMNCDTMIMALTHITTTLNTDMSNSVESLYKNKSFSNKLVITVQHSHTEGSASTFSSLPRLM